MTSVLLLWTQAVTAQTSLFPEEHATYSLDITRETADWADGEMTFESRSNRVTLRYYEAINKQAWGGVQLGHITVTQTGNPLTDGLQLSGYFVGAMLRGDVTINPAWSFELAGSYVFNNTSAEQTAQTIRSVWHELGLDAGLVYRNRALSVEAGAGGRIIDVDEVARGTVTQTRSYKQDSVGHVRLGTAYWVDATGYVGIELVRGAWNGTRLLFGRQY